MLHGVVRLAGMWRCTTARSSCCSPAAGDLLKP